MRRARARLLPFTVGSLKKKTTGVLTGTRMVRAPEVWDKSNYGEGAVIAVLDTGCQPDHPDLKDNIVGGINFTSEYGRNLKKYDDNNGHGTHVAGIIAACNDETGVYGVAPKAKLLIVKVMDKEGSGSFQQIIRGINYALYWRGNNGEKVRVISMSLGSTQDSFELHKAVARAIAKDIVVVCAAGNMGDGDAETEEVHYPGGYSEVIQVGAVDSDRKIAYFSNTNNEVDLVAPGVNILSTYLDSEYASLSGTSMAAPHIAGAAALVINQCEKEFKRSLSEAEIYAQICRRTVSLGYKKWEEGNGLLDLTQGQ